MEVGDAMKMEIPLGQTDQELFFETQPFDGLEGDFYIEELATELNIELPLDGLEEEPVKRRRKSSDVWNHFHIVDAGGDNKRAICNRCNKSYSYSIGTKVNGTSHLKRHMEKGGCTAVLTKQASETSSAPPRPPRRRSRPDASVPADSFDADRCNQDITRMVIMHDYPLHIGEQSEFVTFVKNLQPQFDMVTFNTIEGDCLATYTREKQEIQKLIANMPGQICLTLDLWLSSRAIGYVFVTGQFIDSNGNIQRKLMNVIRDPFPDSESALSHSVAACLSDWGMEGKLFTVTVNQQLSDAAANNVRALLSTKSLNGQLLVESCLAHSLTKTAQIAFALSDGVVKKVRDFVKYLKTADSREENFLAVKHQLEVPSSKCLSIDDQTRWNTTYEMLIAALELKLVFFCMDTSDPDYKGDLSAVDWEQIEMLCSYLKPLFDLANRLTLQTCQMSSMFFHEVCDIQTKLAGAAARSIDPFESALTKSMNQEFSKYWNSCCYILSIAAVMDPRFKTKILEFSFSKLCGREAAAEYVKVVIEGIKELFHEYAALPLSSSPASVAKANGTTMKDQNAGHLEGFDAYLEESKSSQVSRSELEQYLVEKLNPRVHDFDVIGWWEEKRITFPTLSRMAHDILSIPFSTVPASSVFNTELMKMDSHRCELRPETVEALFCAKDWLQSKKVEDVETLDAVVKMEEVSLPGF